MTERTERSMKNFSATSSVTFSDRRVPHTPPPPRRRRRPAAARLAARGAAGRAGPCMTRAAQPGPRPARRAAPPRAGPAAGRPRWHAGAPRGAHNDSPRAWGAAFLADQSRNSYPLD
jgi:hypothetical protein